MTEDMVRHAHRGFTRKFLRATGKKSPCVPAAYSRPTVCPGIWAIRANRRLWFEAFKSEIRGHVIPADYAFILTCISLFFVLNKLHPSGNCLWNWFIIKIYNKLLLSFPSFTRRGKPRLFAERVCTQPPCFWPIKSHWDLLAKFFWFNPTCILQIWLPWVWIFMRSTAFRKHLFY